MFWASKVPETGDFAWAGPTKYEAELFRQLADSTVVRHDNYRDLKMKSTFSRRLTFLLCGISSAEALREGEINRNQYFIHWPKTLKGRVTSLAGDARRHPNRC